MGFPKIIIGLSVALTFMVSSCVSHKIWVQETPQDEQVSVLHASSPTLPRKLMLDEESKMKNIGNKHYMPLETKEQALPDKLHEGQEVEAGGTDVDPSEYSTADYHPVKRRAPIHNKFVPVAP